MEEIEKDKTAQQQGEAGTTTTPANAYSLYDFLTMEPGALIMGIAKKHGVLTLSREWDNIFISSPEVGFLPHTVISEWKLQIKSSKTPTIQFHGIVSVYHAYDHEMLEWIKTIKEKNVWRIKRLVPGEPIGVFLGNILRVNGMTLVNVLMLDGEEVWI